MRTAFHFPIPWPLSILRSTDESVHRSGMLVRSLAGCAVSFPKPFECCSSLLAVCLPLYRPLDLSLFFPSLPLRLPFPFSGECCVQIRTHAVVSARAMLARPAHINLRCPRPHRKQRRIALASRRKRPRRVGVTLRIEIVLAPPAARANAVNNGASR